VPSRYLIGIDLGTTNSAATYMTDEGPRLMTNLVGIEPDPARLRIGMPVEVAFDDIAPEFALPRFRPAS